MWGSRLLCRLSSYEEVLAAVNIQPLVSSAVEAAKEDLYEVLEEVRCPTLMATARNNCPNEKPGGLAQNIYKCVTSFLPHCLDTLPTLSNILPIAAPAPSASSASLWS